MVAPFRIYRTRPRAPQADAAAATGTPPSSDEAWRAYFDRLIRLIPSEIVALYVAGAGIIGDDAGDVGLLIGWVVFCLFALVLLRRWGTKETPSKNTQWKAVAISAAAFVVWVYYLGGPFRAFPQIYNQKVAGLLVLALSFLAPYFYDGDDPPPPATPTERV